jgi:hypothetical protein
MFVICLLFDAAASVSLVPPISRATEHRNLAESALHGTSDGHKSTRIDVKGVTTFGFRGAVLHEATPLSQGNNGLYDVTNPV